MNKLSIHNTQRIISTALYQIDVENNKYIHIPIPATRNDELESYLSELLSEVKDRPQKRAYEFLRETTELFTSLKSYYLEQDLEENVLTVNLVSRLLDKEIDADRKYGHLNVLGTGHIKKGSFLQFIYREGSVVSYLGVKIDHQSFLDEADFKKRIGLSLTNKIYKACSVNFDAAGLPYDVYVYDTNTKPSVYWWKEFLELKELRDDSLNTKTAIEAVVRSIGVIKKDFLSDYNLLRNAAIAAFKQTGQMDFHSFVTNTFEKYVPDDAELVKKMPSIISSLRELPEKKNFDTEFTLDPKAVTFRNTKIVLSKEISLSIEEGIEHIETKIWSEQTSDGRKLVVINSPIAFSQFKLKNREK